MRPGLPDRADGWRATVRDVSGILSGPIDDPAAGRRRKPSWPVQPATPGLVVRHRTSGVVGKIVRFNPQRVTLRQQNGREIDLPVSAGAFSVGGQTVSLTPAPRSEPDQAVFTASGSVAVERHGARVAQPSRLLVEGVHDAELVEKIWGDDLRVEGVVVEPMHGADDLTEIINDFRPGPDRRLGILLDHMRQDRRTKESRLADAAAQEHVLIRGHKFVDIWQAIKPSVVGIDAWPVIEHGIDWKTGILTALGFGGTTGELWRVFLSRVASYRDLEPSLVGAVEELIDFVAPPPADY